MLLLFLLFGTYLIWKHTDGFLRLVFLHRILRHGQGDPQSLRNWALNGQENSSELLDKQEQVWQLKFRTTEKLLAVLFICHLLEMVTSSRFFKMFNPRVVMLCCSDCEIVCSNASPRRVKIRALLFRISLAFPFVCFSCSRLSISLSFS